MKRTTYVDDLVIQKLTAMTADPKTREMALKKAKSLTESELAPLEIERAKLQAELAKLSDSFSRWADRLDEGLIDEAQFVQRNDELLERKRVMVDRLAGIGQMLSRREQVALSWNTLRPHWPTSLDCGSKKRWMNRRSL